MTGEIAANVSDAASLRVRSHAASIAQRLIRHRASLLLCLLLVSALFRPYAGIIHDARLYALQMADHLYPTVHDDDLYLKFGSQDKYSLFSQVARPISQALGIPMAFFVVYLIGNLCWLLAAQRLILTMRRQGLLPHAGAAVGALVYITVVPMAFGGFTTFHVNENFLTPRLWSVALVMCGLNSLICERPIRGFLWIISSMLLHPIMGFSGLCLCVLWTMMTWIRPKHFVFVMAAVLAGLAGSLWPPLGTMVFGHMDTEWREIVIAPNVYCVPLAWPVNDWLRIATAFGIVISGRIILSDASAAVRRLLDAVVLLAAVGMVLGAVAPMLPYRLLLQGQPYRALWPLQLIQIPVLFGLTAHWLMGRQLLRAKLVTWAALACFASVTLSFWQLVGAGCILAGVVCWGRSLERPAAEASVWLRRSWIGWCAGSLLGCVALIASYPLLASYYTPLERLASVPLIIGPFFTWTAAVALMILMCRWIASDRMRMVAAASGGLALQSLFFLVPYTSLYESLGIEQAEDNAFVREHIGALQEEASSRHRLTVYWPLGPLDVIWFHLGCDSFYSIPQTAGSMFNRATAVEGYRRMQLAREFELHARDMLFDHCHYATIRSLRNTFGDRLKGEPSFAAFKRLCEDEQVGLLVLPHRFEGLYTATNGRLFIYDAREIRASSASL